MAYDSFDENGQKLGGKGYFFTKTTIAIVSFLVVALLIAEGLIIGLAGRPECEVYGPIDATTTKPTTTTSSTTTSTTTTTTNEMSTTTAESGPWTSYRMPLNLIPYEYEVSLRPVLDLGQPIALNNYVFYGSSTVRYVCDVPTNYIILHSRLLDYTLDDWSLTKIDDGLSIALTRMFFYEPNYYVILESEAACEQGASYELALAAFTGQLRSDNTGFYSSDYFNSDGEYVVIATTQMESSGARKTFPCFDEPSFKAQFVIKLWHKTNSDYLSLSNMPVQGTREETIDGVLWTETTFDQSVVMPTYLLAMVVSDFGAVQNRTSDGLVQTNIYARKEYISAGEADYAAIITPAQLDFFEDYTGIIYPLAKSDQICVPDFAAGAMENWGLVIYREEYLMYNDTSTSDRYKIFITSIIGHELAHQWFGNLVSCEWWDQLWLNEGFATYYSYLGENAVQPTWKPLIRFIPDEIRRAFGVDELTTSRPIIREVNSQADIGAMFDTITYQKGGSVLRMVNGFMGEENFVNANKEYLTAQAYGVANQDQLFSYWEKYTSHLSLPTELSIIMETWTLQMGFPLVTVTDSEPLTNTFTVGQEYYLRNADAVPTHTTGSLKYGYKWYIPFFFKRGSNLARESELVWITPDQPLTLTESDFILGNSEVQGYYRVNYDRGSWERIANRLDSEFYVDIPEENRAQLLDDAFSLASSGRLNPVIPIQMSAFLHRDDSYFAWDTFVDNIKYYEYMLGRTEVFGTFKSFVLEMVVPSLYDKYGWEDGARTDDKMLERQSRAIAIDAACYYEHPDCVETATNYFQDWMTSPDDYTIIPASYRSDILCAAIRAGDIEEWNFAFERYGSTNHTGWKSSLRYGMACSKDPWVLNRYLTYTLDSNKIAFVDAISSMRYIGREEYGRDIAWAFMINNWDELLAKFGSPVMFSGLVLDITRRFSTEFDLKLLQDFKETTPDLGGLAVSVDSAIETTNANINWRAANEDTLTQWFYDNVDGVV